MAWPKRPSPKRPRPERPPADGHFFAGDRGTWVIHSIVFEAMDTWQNSFIKYKLVK